jgi:hypothetical protein
MLESELQYLLAPESSWAIPQSLAGKNMESWHQEDNWDHYYDTPEKDLAKLGITLRVRQKSERGSGEWQLKVVAAENELPGNHRHEFSGGHTFFAPDDIEFSRLPRVLQAYLPQGHYRLVGLVHTDMISVRYGDDIIYTLEVVTYPSKQELRLEVESDPSYLAQANKELVDLYGDALSVPERGKYLELEQDGQSPGL